MMKILDLCEIFYDYSLCVIILINELNKLFPFKIMEIFVILFLFFYSYIVMTTSGGIMDHEEARRKHLGGKILGFFF